MCTSQAALRALAALVHVVRYLLLLRFHVLLLVVRPLAALVLAHQDNLLGMEVLLQRNSVKLLGRCSAALLAVMFVYDVFLLLVVIVLVLWLLEGCRVRVAVQASPRP